MEYTNNDQIVIGEKDIEKINEFAKKRNKTIIELLVNMFDPSIIGNRIAKEASIVCLSYCGDDLEKIKDFKSRNRINVLLAGDPGNAKSLFIEKNSSISSEEQI